MLRCLFRETPSIKWTVIHPNDESDARSNLGEFREFARENRLDLLVAASTREAKEMLASLRPDIGLVCGWYWLLDAETLGWVKEGLWGIHNSLLPKYRGISPLVWSIINGDEVVGSTVFRISPGMDDGEVLHQVKVRLEPSHDIADALSFIQDGLLNELPARWRALTCHQASLARQDEALATYCGQRLESDGLVDWSKKATDVHNFIRAQAPPYPCAYAYLGQTKLRFLKTRVFEGTYFGTPGQVLQRNDRSVLVACGGNSALEVLRARVGDDEQEAPPSKLIRSIKDRLLSAPASPRGQ